MKRKFNQELGLIQIGPLSVSEQQHVENVLWLMGVPERMYETFITDKRYIIVRNIDEQKAEQFVSDYKLNDEFLKSL